MIRNFADHSANERTFLAWIRTSIAVMAFGFLVEKFDLGLEVAPSVVGRSVPSPDQEFGNLVGLALIVLGAAMIAVSAIRFLATAKAIDSDERHLGPGSRIDLALAGVLALLGCALFAYLSHAIVTKL
jgi:putative membrane protein